MKPRALVVEDDDRIVDSIEDALFSIGHDHEWVTNQHDAQQLLREGDYSYVLLDLQIPAKPNRGGANKEFGVNLLGDIQRIKGPSQLPVIVMTAYSADCLDLSTELFAGGASDFIAKPFLNEGRTLAKVIRKVLADHERHAPPDPPPGGRPFAGGELTFFVDHVELCGVKIITDLVELYDQPEPTDAKSTRVTTVYQVRWSKAGSAQGGRSPNAAASITSTIRIRSMAPM